MYTQDLEKEFPNAIQVINDVKDLYSMTEGTMADILQFLKIYGEPINTKPVIPPARPQPSVAPPVAHVEPIVPPPPEAPVVPPQPGYIGLTNPNVPFSPPNFNDPYFDSFDSMSSETLSLTNTGISYI